MQQNNQWPFLRPRDDGVKPNSIHGHKERFSFHPQSRERALGHRIHVTDQGQSLSLALPNQPYRRGGRSTSSKAKQ